MIPTPLHEWVEQNIPSEHMLWRDAAREQCVLFSAILQSLNLDGYVVDTHTSKSIALPVVRVIAPDVGTVWFRGNFHHFDIGFDLTYVPDIPAGLHSLVGWISGFGDAPREQWEDGMHRGRVCIYTPTRFKAILRAIFSRST